MKACEIAQIELSALLDGEVDAHSLTAALDHAMDCPDCRLDYRAFRSLGRDLERLERQMPARRALATSYLRSFALAACAVLGLCWAWSTGAPAVASAPARSVEIQLGSRPELMDDARFVAIAVEILQADPRYARSMKHLLDRVGDGRDHPFEPQLAEAGAPDTENDSITRLYH